MRLIKNAPQLQSVKDAILDHSYSFLNVEAGVVSQGIEENMGKGLQYNMQSKDELPVMTEQLAADFKSLEGLKVVNFNLKSSISGEELNLILQSIE